MERDIKGTAVFQSVILAGVYDVRNLKRKLRSDGEHKVNSPWNIAADFDIDMALSKSGIRDMLLEYGKDHDTEMDAGVMAGLLCDYTSGYPYLVSRLCKFMDEKICAKERSENKKIVWNKERFLEAVRMLLSENNALFESLTGKLSDFPELNRMLSELLFSGKTISYHPANPAMNLALMFGFIKNEEGKAIPANRIFDTFLYNHFLSADEMHASDMYEASLQDKNLFVVDGHLNMRRVMERFAVHFHELYGNCGESQLAGYLDDYGLNRGYLLSFNFNQNKQVGVHEMFVGGKVLIEAVV